MSDLLSALVVVFVAELGDKTQLVALGFGARYRLAPVVIGIGLAYVGAGVVSVVTGAFIGAALPTRLVSIGGGLLFIAFAIWTLVDADTGATDTDDVTVAEQGKYTVDGTCETSGADITFTSPGDPCFTIGITTSGAPAVGNFNSPSDGVGFLVGSRAESEVVVTIGDGTFTIAGDLDVLDGSVIDGVVDVTCTG